MQPGLDQLNRLAAADPLAPGSDRFYFLRHGQTARNAERVFQDVDEPLSALGQAQAVRAGEVLAGEPIRCIVCSDARRAFDTAQAVGARLGITPEAVPGLRERHFGALIGTSSIGLDWAYEPTGGETLAQFVQRTRDALEQALARPGPVLVVAHGGSLYVAAGLLGITVDMQVLGNAQPLRFVRNGPTWCITALLQPAADGSAALA